MVRSLVLLGLASVASALSANIRLEDFDYPFPEQTYTFESQQQELEMVYMDVPAKGEPQGTVLLLHGKNFSGSYFEQTAEQLSQAGYRVVIPDQIGFGKSTKPEHYQYSFQQLATNTHELLKQLGVDEAHVLGHSMGGMVATRYALMFPDETVTLTLMNPIGLEDWKAKGVPYQPIDEGYQEELNKTPEQIRQYQLEFYYDGQWKEAYDPWVEQLTSFIEGDDYPRMAWNQALTSDMVFTQPVVYEFGDIEAPTLLIIGQRDRTAIGKGRASKEDQQDLGNYPKLGRAAKKAIPDAKLVELDGIGHLPHIEAFDRFFPPYRKFLDRHAE
ncbi:MAG: alpha/beta hydrolase [Verrucomicrobiota bacterium JB022]|nr:alpha/beta hydrolase [Verrucomicrobiota bacterium JB022]